MDRKGMNGFTLPELMTVVALVGILATMAHASFQDVASRGRLNGAIEMIRMDIQQARYSSLVSNDHYHIDFEPQTRSYLLNGQKRVFLPEGIRFGADPGVKGKPNQPGEIPPVDGITFKGDGVQNRAEFFPKGVVVPTGAVYVTSGKETMAITLYLNGHVRMWVSNGGNKWTLL